MMRHADDFAFDYLPPTRKRERGSRPLGEQVVLEPEEKPPKPARLPSESRRTNEEAVKAKAAAAAAEAEARAFALAEGVAVSDEQKAMLRILYELFSPKHLSFSKPFVDRDEANQEGITHTLVEVLTRFAAGEYHSISDFASDVRGVFAHCYMKFGGPMESFLGKRCTRLDEVFEQNVTLLPRSMREGALAVASILRQDSDTSHVQGGGDDEKRRSSRAKVGSQQSTLQLVQQNKARIMMQQEQEKNRLAREHRERLHACAKAWELEHVDAERVCQVRAHPDAVSAVHFVCSFASALELESVTVADLELGLSQCGLTSSVMRVAVDCLLRRSTARLPGPPAAVPTAAALTTRLADRLQLWSELLAMATSLENEEEDLPEDLLPYTEGCEMYDALMMMGSPSRLRQKLLGLEHAPADGEAACGNGEPPRAEQGKCAVDGDGSRETAGLDRLDIDERALLLYALCEEVVLTDRGLVSRLNLDEAASACRATLLGRDSAGKWYYWFAAVEHRLYQLDAPWSVKQLKKALDNARHVVSVGEWIEVEVQDDEAVGSEWRLAEVRRLLNGGKGRFLAVVNGPDGQPDEDFREVFTLPQMGKDWRKRGAKGKKDVKELKEGKETKEAKEAKEAKESLRRVEPLKKEKLDSPAPLRSTRHSISSPAPTKSPREAAPATDSSVRSAGALATPPSSRTPRANAPKPEENVRAEREKQSFVKLDVRETLRTLQRSKSAVDKRLVSALKPYEKLQADSAPTRNRHWVAALLRVMEDMQVPELLALKKKDNSIMMQMGEPSGQDKERRANQSQATAPESELMEVDG